MDKFKEGDIVKVKVLEVDKHDRTRLSVKAGPQNSWNLLPEAKDPHFAVLVNDPPRL